MCQVTHHFHADRFHRDFSQARFERREEKFSHGRCSAKQREIRTQHQRIGCVEIEEFIELPCVARQNPFLRETSNRSLATAHWFALGGSSDTEAVGFARALGSIDSRRGGVHTAGEIVVMVMMMVVVRPGRSVLRPMRPLRLLRRRYLTLSEFSGEVRQLQIR